MTRDERYVRSQKGRLLFALIRVGANLQQYLEGVLEPLGMTPLELQVMRIVSYQEWPSIAAVARNVGIAKQSVRGPLRTLESAGLIEFGSWALDRRQRALRLTLSGEERLEILLAQLAEAERRFIRDTMDPTFRLDTWLEEGVWELRPTLRPPNLRMLLRRSWI